MKKFLLLVLILLSVVLGYSLARPFDPFDKLRVFDSLRSLRSSTLRSLGLEEVNQPIDQIDRKTAILRVGLVADSHNENDLLEKALAQAQGKAINFVIGLGDYTNLGTVAELTAAKRIFDDSGLQYYVIPGDRDGWESRQNGLANNTNFVQVFGPSSQAFKKNSIQFVLLDNSDIYSGISQEDWEVLSSKLEARNYKLSFVFAHKTAFHPESSHIMGEDSVEVAEQAKRLLNFLEGEAGGPERSRRVDGFFAGDLHFFATYFVSPRIVTKATEIDVSVALHNSAQFSTKGGSTGGKSPQQSVRITTVGAVASERNFQGPRFAILTVYEDFTWEVEDVEIR